MKHLLIAFMLAAVSHAQTGLWITPAELERLPTSGAGWDVLVSEANAAGPVNLSDQDDDHDRYLLAKALRAARLDDQGEMAEVEALLLLLRGTEDGGRTLALGRNLQAVVAAASLIRWTSRSAEDAFKTWLRGVRTEELDGRTLVSTHEDRPNNWGTHAGASRLLASAYVEDWADTRECAKVFAGWLGCTRVYDDFSFGELDWQWQPTRPVGINWPGASIQGHSVDGVLPDDQRRSGGFTWPPPRENYVYEALQGALVQALTLERLGYPGFWHVRQDALLRAFEWLHEEARFPAEGDDEWQPWLVNQVYGASFPTSSGARGGKGAGAFTEWLTSVGHWPSLRP